MSEIHLSETQWERLQESIKGFGGYITDGCKAHFEGILWRIKNGTPWRVVPEKYGNWNTIYKKFLRWSRNGSWGLILEEVEGYVDLSEGSLDSTYVKAHKHSAGAPFNQETAIGISRGGRTTKIHALVDKDKRVLDMSITEGNCHDVIEGERIIEGQDVDILIADKAYDSENFRQEVRNIGAKPVVPKKGNSAKPNPEFDKTTYKKRHVVENFFCRIKEFRSVATRYDKLKITFESTVKIAVIALWI